LENVLTRARGIDPRVVCAVVAGALFAGVVAVAAAGRHQGLLTLLAAAAAAAAAVAVVSITCRAGHHFRHVARAATGSRPLL
jgi:hypothetical protein